MSEATTIQPKSTGDKFDAIYHDVETAIGDAKAMANLLSAVDQHNCDTNAAGYTLERILMNAEEILGQLWQFKPGTPRPK